MPADSVSAPRPGTWIDDLTDWYAGAARDLPWRAPGTTPYAVLVSEVMLQQTPVARVVPAYDAWLARWPTAAALAADPSGEAVRMWGRLGYPRRALRLHAACTDVVARFGGELPTTVPELLSLPGVGDYTARAVAAFALRQRHPVVDTNVRRVVARLVEGVGDAPVTKRDLAFVAELLPAEDEAAATVSIALMELGALVCTARAPRCTTCPVAGSCTWLAAGSPPLASPVRRPQGYAGTDRQVRGRLLAVLRDSDDPVDGDVLAQVWDQQVQRARALDCLVADGLVDPLPDGRYALPGHGPARGSNPRMTSTSSTRSSLRK
jgi:A/G-specific adenine glycosylase